MVKELNGTNFDTEVIEMKGAAFVDLYAVWCGPCKMMAPLVEELSEENPDVRFYKLDVDQAMEIAQRYRVAAIPTFLQFKDGELKNKVVGGMEKSALQALITEHK